MPHSLTRIWSILALLVASACSYAQSASPDSLADKLTNFPNKFFSRVQSKTASLDHQLTRQTQRYLQKMASREEKLRKKLYAVDSNSAKTLFAGSAERYAALAQKLKNDSGSKATGLSGEYRPFTDSLRGTLAFLQKNQQLIGSGSISRLQGASGELQALQAKIQDAGQIREFLEQRKAQIGQYLSKYTNLSPGITNTYNNYKKDLVYYKQQVNEYKDVLNDPDKMFRTALGVLNKVPSFSNFMKSNSALSGLFNMSGGAIPGPGAGGLGSATSATAATTTGLQSRDQVLSVIQTQLGQNGPNAASLSQQNIGSAQGQVDELRSKLSSNSGADADIPNFTPNSQKTKTFLKRLEFGTNLQTNHSDYYFPTTTDIGLSLGYRLSDNNTIGIGASYKIGWGSDIHHVSFSSQGVGLRSFLDVRLKKTWFATGGFEYNYQQPFTSIKPLQDLSHWQKSGLVGISKIISMKTRVFKNTKIQLLWDFLSYQQIPKTQAFLFRIGYSF